MAEHFAHEQFALQRCAIHLQACALVARAQAMQRSGDQFLSRSALSENQHRRIMRRGSLDDVENDPHFVIARNEVVKHRFVSAAPPAVPRLRGSSFLSRTTASTESAMRQNSPQPVSNRG